MKQILIVKKMETFCRSTMHVNFIMNHEWKEGRYKSDSPNIMLCQGSNLITRSRIYPQLEVGLVYYGQGKR